MVYDVIFNTNSAKSCILGMQMDFDIPSISAIVAAIGVLIGVILTVLELRHLAKSRRIDSYWRILSTFNSKEYLEALMKVYSLEFKDYDDFNRKYGDFLSGKSEMAVPLGMVCDLFQGAGFLFRNGLIEYDIVRQFPVIPTWEKVKAIAAGASLWKDFEYLNNELKKREQAGVNNG
jgi:hypothetical protein